MFLLVSGRHVGAHVHGHQHHTNLYKSGENVSSHIFHEKNCCDLNLGESLCICTFFLFPDSGLNLLNGFYFFILVNFEWRDTENTERPIAHCFQVEFREFRIVVFLCREKNRRARKKILNYLLTMAFHVFYTADI